MVAIRLVHTAVCVNHFLEYVILIATLLFFLSLVSMSVIFVFFFKYVFVFVRLKSEAQKSNRIGNGLSFEAHSKPYVILRRTIDINKLQYRMDHTLRLLVFTTWYVVASGFRCCMAVDGLKI